MSYTENEVRQMVKDRAAALGIRALAREIGVNQGDISYIVGGRKAIGPAVLRGLGLRKTVSYEKESCNPSTTGA